MRNAAPTRAALLVSVALVLNGCAGPGPTDPASGAPPGSGGSADPVQACNPFIVGAGAAALCGAIASGNQRLRAGAACAAVAMTACWLANSYRSQQTRSGQQVQDDWLRQNRQLPERATVTAYSSSVEPRRAVTRGQEVRLSSTIVVVPGRNDRGVSVEEEVAVVDGRGEVWGRPVRKLANGGSQAGEFRTSFVVPVTEGMSQGVYAFRRSLYVNGAAVQRDDANARFQVVRGGEPGGADALARLP